MKKGMDIIPSKFSSVDQFLVFISRFKEYIDTHIYLITDNLRGDSSSYIVTTMYSMTDDLLSMFNRCLSLYEVNESKLLPAPYYNMP